MDVSRESKGRIELGELSISTLDGVVHSMKQRLSEGKADAPILEAMIPAVQHGELRFPVVPETAMRAQQMMRDPEVSIEELTAAVSLDPALATKVVGVANSAYFC
ncbi:MAG: HDOD domain-containing protein, partial [Myxococcales bacterium]|nr:HDOD domain-containing protein [Myxococcales bacterium]